LGLKHEPFEHLSHFLEVSIELWCTRSTPAPKTGGIANGTYIFSIHTLFEVSSLRRGI